MEKKLNQKIWDGTELREDVKGKLFKIAFFFYDTLKIEVPIQDIIITGSLANFNWRQDSDLDCHLVLNFGELPMDKQMAVEYLMAKKELFNSTRNIKIKGFEVEVYPQDISQQHHSSGIYSILQDKWIIKPKAIQKPDNGKDVLKLSSVYKQVISGINDIKDDELKLDLAKTVKKDIVSKRKKGLEAGGEQSLGNQLFKKLRRDDFYNLFNSISRTQDRILSLEHKKPSN